MKQKDTSWGSVAEWYDDYLGNEDSYQSNVIAPNLLRILALKKGEVNNCVNGITKLRE